LQNSFGSIGSRDSGGRRVIFSISFFRFPLNLWFNFLREGKLNKFLEREVVQPAERVCVSEREEREETEVRVVSGSVQQTEPVSLILVARVHHL
jgi:hypothetical protein